MVNYLKSYLRPDTDLGNGLIFWPTNKVKVQSEYTIPYQYNGNTNTDLRLLYEFVVRIRRENPSKLLLYIAEIGVHRKTYNQEEINVIQTALSVKENI